MKYPIDVAMSGAVSLGPDIACDGFLYAAKARAQTHIHLDHMNGFHASKGCQEIIVTEPTRRLLVFEYNADLPYRSNIRSLPDGTGHFVNGNRISLTAGGHMLGAAQVIVESEDGMRLGYSGDFHWPIDKVIQVDALVVDSTYGSPRSIRRYTQGECESRFLTLVKQQLARRPVYVYAHRGSVQRALQLLSDEIDCPLICSARLCEETAIYREFGYPIGGLIRSDSPEAGAAMGGRRFLRFFGTGDQRPVDITSVSTFKLSAYFARPDDPIVEYSERSFGVALSNHADFAGTIEYVRSTGAKYVVTDNSRGGKAYELAMELQQRLGIEARPSSNLDTHEWGSG
jgi:putative mRNA 3-end processing factor